MFPIRDHNPSRSTPVITMALMAANVIVFVLYWPKFGQEADITQFFQQWGLVPAMVSDGQNLHGFVTSMFLHGGLMHLGGNMLFLWIFGDNLEDRMGHIPFLGFYLISGLAAAFGQYFAEPQSFVPMVGASGAIAGVMGGYLLLYPKARVDVLLIIFIIVRVVQLPAWIILGLWFGLQVLSGLSTPTDSGGVAYWAHAGGFLAGLLLSLPYWLKDGGVSYWQQTRGLPPHPKAQYPITRTSIPKVRRRK